MGGCDGSADHATVENQKLTKGPASGVNTETKPLWTIYLRRAPMATRLSTDSVSADTEGSVTSVFQTDHS